MTRSELLNNSLKTDSLTPNAPFHYVVAGSQGIMLAATMLLLYIIIVVVGLICGLGWGSLLLPILVYHLLLGIAVAALWTYNKLIS